MSDRPSLQRFVGLCVPFLFVMAVDGSLTLAGQSAEYWSGSYDRVRVVADVQRSVAVPSSSARRGTASGRGVAFNVDPAAGFNSRSPGASWRRYGYPSLARHGPSMMRAGCFKIALNSQYSINEYILLLSKSFVFLSLSREPSDVTMWAHYADSHRGFLIGFDEEHEFFRPNDRFKAGLRPMDYDDSRLQLTAEMLRDQSARIDSHDKVFFNKSRAWAYEKEMRVISYPDKADCVKRQYTAHPIYLFRFPPDLVKEIHLGFRMSAETKEEILALQQNRYSQARVFQMHIDKYAYALNAIPYAQAVADEASAKKINETFVDALQRLTSDPRPK